MSVGKLRCRSVQEQEGRQQRRPGYMQKYYPHSAVGVVAASVRQHAMQTMGERAEEQEITLLQSNATWNQSTTPSSNAEGGDADFGDKIIQPRKF
ncbi:hypothetical protein GWK47_017536 [Chionoecetes opilio]|uniref:Uncharacterized protein n=1 Tax=Chionoecetes opilio TaxID=41210 RepID=A0A8J4XTV0_CHIOP|nr:hypothetical protein GWK47_017536 [Chionoecetes opilio]